MTSLNSESSISHQTTMNYCSLWQEMSETTQGEIRGGMNDTSAIRRQPEAGGKIRGTLLFTYVNLTSGLAGRLGIGG